MLVNSENITLNLLSVLQRFEGASTPPVEQALMRIDHALRNLKADAIAIEELEISGALNEAIQFFEEARLPNAEVALNPLHTCLKMLGYDVRPPIQSEKEIEDFAKALSGYLDLLCGMHAEGKSWEVCSKNIFVPRDAEFVDYRGTTQGEQSLTRSAIMLLAMHRSINNYARHGSISTTELHGVARDAGFVLERGLFFNAFSPDQSSSSGIWLSLQRVFQTASVLGLRKGKSRRTYYEIKS